MRQRGKYDSFFMNSMNHLTYVCLRTWPVYVQWSLFRDSSFALLSLWICNANFSRRSKLFIVLESVRWSPVRCFFCFSIFYVEEQKRTAEWKNRYTFWNFERKCFQLYVPCCWFVVQGAPYRPVLLYRVAKWRRMAWNAWNSLWFSKLRCMCWRHKAILLSSSKQAVWRRKMKWTSWSILLLRADMNWRIRNRHPNTSIWVGRYIIGACTTIRIHIVTHKTSLLMMKRQMQTLASKGKAVTSN